MATDNGSTQSPFDMYVKEFQLRLDLIKTMGQWNKDMADAALTSAMALGKLEEAKTKTW